MRTQKPNTQTNRLYSSIKRHTSQKRGGVRCSDAYGVVDEHVVLVDDLVAELALADVASEILRHVMLGGHVAAQLVRQFDSVTTQRARIWKASPVDHVVVLPKP